MVAERKKVRTCRDCPWRREALPGWLGSYTPQEWIKMAHGETVGFCHTGGVDHPQCAGFATYRANVAKVPRDPDQLLAEPDRENVFSSPQEFIDHHTRPWED